MCDKIDFVSNKVQGIYNSRKKLKLSEYLKSAIESNNLISY